MIEIKTTYDVGDKVLFDQKGKERIGIIESVEVTVIKAQTEWPLLHHPESGKVETMITNVSYSLKSREGIFKDKHLRDGSHIKSVL